MPRGDESPLRHRISTPERQRPVSSRESRTRPRLEAAYRSRLRSNDRELREQERSQSRRDLEQELELLLVSAGQKRKYEEDAVELGGVASKKEHAMRMSAASEGLFLKSMYFAATEAFVDLAVQKYEGQLVHETPKTTNEHHGLIIGSIMPRIYEEMDLKYAATCSDVTLCSNSKGFFTSLADELLSMATPEWIQELEKAEEERKVAFVMENQEMMSALSEVLSRIQPLHRGKSARVSIERRTAAQKALQEGDFTKALALASQAVLRSPMTGEEEVLEGGVSLALSLWVRSEVLLRSNQPKAALEDLKLALKERLPAKMRAQYYWRMGHCYKGTGEPSRAKVSYELAGRLLGNNAQAKSQLTQDVDSLDYSVTPKYPPDKTRASLTGGAKQNMPSLSKLLKICEEENKGRFAVADSPIKTGDILLVDSPYAACLLSDYYGSHCLNCFKRMVDCEDSAPIWCPKCSGVAFCSIQCRDSALSTYHSYECQFLDLFIGSGMSILSHVALRMVTQAGLDTSLSIHSKFLSNKIKTVEGTVLNDVEGIAKKSKMKSRKERLNRSKKSLKNFAEKNLREEDVENNKEDKMSFEEKLELKAAQIYSLCTHWDQRRGEDYLKRIIMGMFLSECLKKGGFFKKSEKETADKAQTSICELIVRNLQLLQFNAHEIFETIRGSHMFSGSKPLYVAVGIYPAGALFNHECYPAVSRYFDGRNIVFAATRPLSPGEVVSENYGPHFMMRDVRNRQRSLACRYWFKCQCPACMEDWPTLKQMPEGQVYLRCSNLSCSWKFRATARPPNRCPKCSVNVDPELVKISLRTVDDCIAEYQKGAKLMDTEQPLEVTNILCAALDTFHSVARPPHRETHLAQEALRSCFATFGNTHKVQPDDVTPNKENGTSE